MKFINISILKTLTLTAITASLFTIPAFAATYTGGDFTVTIDGSGGSASYTGCDRKERCVHIPTASNYSQGRYAWEWKGYTYRMIPENNSNQYILKVSNSRNKVLLAQVMNPIAETDPDYVQDLTENSFCSFIVTNNVDSKVNIRRGPGLNNEVILQLRRGDGVRAVFRRGNWVKIVALVDGFPPNEKFTPFFGWVNNRYINGCSEDQFEMWR